MRLHFSELWDPASEVSGVKQLLNVARGKSGQTAAEADFHEDLRAKMTSTVRHLAHCGTVARLEQV